MTDFADPAAVQAALDASPFQHGLGLRLDALEPGGGIVIALGWHAGLGRQADEGQMHGGALAALIDIAGCYAVARALGWFPPTVDLRIDYLRPAMGGVRAAAHALRVGRTLAVADAIVTDAEGRAVAAGRGTFLTRA